jgi:carbon-monoxide dehydrogenase large subunit
VESRFVCELLGFPYGIHFTALEVDPESGALHIHRYAVAYDVGRVINPVLVKGQIAGGFAQGIGGAILEEFSFDADGQPLAASFMDYGMPRADTLPLLATALSEVPAPSTRLGVRSGGEGGTPPALAAVINAIVDALAELGVSQIEMPATPERVWRAIQAARFAATASRDGP